MVGSVIGAVAGPLIGGIIGGNASSDAADAQSQSSAAAIAEQKRQYDLSRSDLAPYRAVGGAANAQLAYLMGLNPSSVARPTGGLRPLPQGVGSSQSAGLTHPATTTPATPAAPTPIGVPGANPTTGRLWGLGDNIPGAGMGGGPAQIQKFTDKGNNPYGAQQGDLGYWDFSNGGQVWKGVNTLSAPSASPSGPVSTMPTPGVGPLPGETPSTPVSILNGATPSQPTDAYAEQYPGVNTSLGASGSLSKPFGMSDFTADPGYAFRMSEGQKAIERSAAAKGGLMSGAALKDITRFGQDTASGEYQNAYNRYNTNQTNLYNRLAAVSGTGQTSTNTLAGIGQNTANNVSDSLIGSGNAQAAGKIGQANAWSTGLSNAIGGLGNFFSGYQ